MYTHIFLETRPLFTGFVFRMRKKKKKKTDVASDAHSPPNRYGGLGQFSSFTEGWTIQRRKSAFFHTESVGYLMLSVLNYTVGIGKVPVSG